METKTITQGRDGCKVSGAYKLIFPIRKDYYHIRNDGTETAYASVFSDSTDTAEDGVYDIPSGGTLCIRSHGSDTLYVSGEVTVMGTASAVCPFKIGLRGGDGYADVTATGNPVQLDGLQGGGIKAACLADSFNHFHQVGHFLHTGRLAIFGGLFQQFLFQRVQITRRIQCFALGNMTVRADDIGNAVAHQFVVYLHAFASLQEFICILRFCLLPVKRL